MMKITFEQQQELDRLTRGLPQFDVVLESLKQLQKGIGDADTLWLYYYPLCLKKAWGFFQDSEDGHDAAFKLMEHWLEAIKTFDTEQKPTLMAFFERVSRNFFIDYLKHKELGPDIIYGGTPYDDIGNDSEEEEYVAAQTTPPEEIGPDYPYGVLQDSPLDILLNKERLERVSSIREDMPKSHAQVFDLLLQEYTSDEIAKALDRTPNAIALSMSYIRKLVTAV